MTDRLTHLLDTLLPGDGVDWPAAGSAGMAARVTELARGVPGALDALTAILDALPDDFGTLTRTRREGVLRRIEAGRADQFDAVVTASYNAYYTDPAVRDVIERLTGYQNRPPQPLGYELEPFDESLLDAVKARGPIWRPVD